MSIENDKIVTLGGLAEYNKSVPKTAKAAMLMAMADEDSLEQDPSVYEHVLDRQYVKLQEGTPVQLNVPAGTKYICVNLIGANLRTIAPTKVTWIYKDSDYGDQTITYTEAGDSDGRHKVTDFIIGNGLSSAGEFCVAPCAYIATDGALDLDKYQNAGRLTLVNEPAWLTYDSSTGEFIYNAALRDQYDVSLHGLDTPTLPFDTELVGDNGTCPIKGIIYCMLLPHQLKAANAFSKRFDGRTDDDKYALNSGLINVVDGTSYYMYGFNMPEDWDYASGACPINAVVYYFDHFGVARMHSNEQMIDAGRAYDAKVAATT